MKILFLTAYHLPERFASSHLWTSLREQLARYNIEMELHTPIPTREVSKETRQEYKNKKHEEFYNGKLKVHRFSMIAESKNSLQRAFRYLLCYFVQKKKGRNAKNIDLIFVASTPPIQGFMAAKVKKKLKVPFVYCLQDIFPDSLTGTGITKKDSLLWKIGRKIEDYTYRNADKIIVISEDFKKNIMAKGVPEDKIEVVYNWVDEQAVIPVSRENNTLFDEFKLCRDKFYVVYAGNLGQAQNLQIIIDAAKKLKSHEDIKFIIFGTGGIENELKKEIQSFSLRNIDIFPLQPKKQISEVYSLGDVSIVSCKKGLGGSAFPSKTWSIMSAATAVLASFDENTELQKIIKENNIGIFTPSNNVQKFIEAILLLYSNKEKCKQFGQNGRHFILNNLTKEIGTSKYLDVFNRLIKK